MSVNKEDDIYVFITVSLKEFRLNDISPVDVEIRNHEKIEVDRPVKELLITGSGNSIKNPFVLYHADVESVTQGI